MVVAHAKRVEIVPVTRFLSKRGKCSACLADMAKEVDSPDCHPLGDVQVAVEGNDVIGLVVLGGIVRGMVTHAGQGVSKGEEVT